MVSRAVRVLVLALVVGALGDGLLRATPWGLNVLLWTGALLAALAVLVPARGQTTIGVVLPAVVILFAAALAWRDAPALKALNVLALLSGLALIALRAQGVPLRRAGIFDLGLGVTIAGLETMVRPAMLLGNDLRRPGGGPTWSRHAGATGRGLLIATPLLLIFGGLFSEADAVFADIVKRPVNFDAEALLLHLLVTAALAWVAGGFLQTMRVAPFVAPQEATGRAANAGWLGIVEVGVVLGLLDLLFLGFVIIQFRYLFGGAALVEESIGLTYATYARRGFFELVAVVAIALPLLLAAHWLLRSDSRKATLLFRGLAGLQLLLLLVITASAVKRMRLYQREFGLTELRLYTTAFMAWLALLLAWFAVTVLRDRRHHFAFGALITGLATIALLNLLNPDAFIARTNLDRAASGHPFDAPYALSLSADAVPPLIDALPTLAPADQCRIASALLLEWSPSSQSDWRIWSRARDEAWQAVRDNEEMLRGLNC